MKWHMLSYVGLVSADTVSYSQKPRSDGSIVDAALSHFPLQKIERLAAKAIEKNVLENIPDVVISAEVVNQIEAEQLHLSELPNKTGNFDPAALFCESDLLRGLDEPDISGTQIRQKLGFHRAASLHVDGPSGEFPLFAFHDNVVCAKG
jgi:hypothetical protein